MMRYDLIPRKPNCILRLRNLEPVVDRTIHSGHLAFWAVGDLFDGSQRFLIKDETEALQHPFFCVLDQIFRQYVAPTMDHPI